MFAKKGRKEGNNWENILNLDDRVKREMRTSTVIWANRAKKSDLLEKLIFEFLQIRPDMDENLYFTPVFQLYTISPPLHVSDSFSC